MLTTTPLLLLAALTGFSSALPVESALDKRVCGSFITPTTQIELWENDPNTAYPNTAQTDKSVLLYQDVSFNGGVPTLGNKRNALIGFTGPAGAYGCTLGITFPAGFYFPYYSGNPKSISVYAVSEPLPAAPTYNNIVHGSLFGSFNPVDVVGKSITINSKSCPTAAEGGLAFVFAFADEVTNPASIGWTQYVNELNGEGRTGVFLNYNC